MEIDWLSTVGSLLFSLVGGGIAGALVTYLLQTRGKISVQTSRWEYFPRDGRPSGYRFHIVAYNTAILPDGLSDCCVVFSRDSKELLTSRPKRENREGKHEMVFEGGSLPYKPPLEVIELPPRTPVHVEVVGTFEDAEADEACRSDRVEFFGRSPSKGEIRQEVIVTVSPLFTSAD